MPNYTYLIIGAGMAGDAAVKGIREIDANGAIGMIGRESHPPYSRPPLSKKLWQGKALNSIWLGTESLGITLHTDRNVREIDVSKHEVRDERGRYTATIGSSLRLVERPAACRSVGTMSSIFAPLMTIAGSAICPTRKESPQ